MPNSSKIQRTSSLRRQRTTSWMDGTGPSSTIRAVDQAIRTFRVEAQHPIPNHLKRDPAKAGRLRSPRSVVNLRQRNKAPALAGIL